MLVCASVVGACSGSGSDARTPGAGGGRAGASGALTGGHGGNGASGGKGGEGGGGGPRGGNGGSILPATCDQPWPATAPALRSDAWTRLNPPSVTFAGEPQTGAFVQGLAIDPCNPSTIYLCINHFDVSQGAGLYKSVTAGASWTRVGMLDQPVRVRVDPQDPLHLYVADGVRGATMGFWVSRDGGDTWVKPDGWKALTPAVYGIDDLYDVAVDPADFAHALVTFHSPWETATAGANAGVLETTDGGSSWTVHQPMSTWGAGLNVWFLGDANTWLLGTQADGYWRTSDAGATWTHVSTTTMFHGGGQLYRSKTGALYVSSSNGVLRSADGGVTWNSVGSVPPATSVFGDGTRLYSHSAYSLGAGPFVTSLESDGLTWAPLNSDALSDGPFEMALDSTHGILYSANWGNGLVALKLPATP